MANICVIPEEVTGANQVSDPYHVSALARDYDEIVIAFGNNTETSDTARTLNIIQLINKPLWIIPYSKVDRENKTPTQHRQATLDLITAQIALIFTTLNNASLGSLLKGFAFDKLNFSTLWGDPVTIPDDAVADFNNPWRVNRIFINSCIALSRARTKPVMLIAENPNDALSYVYPTDADFPGAAAWPTLIGSDSGLRDWIVIQDPILAPQYLISNSTATTPLAYAWHRLTHVTTAKNYRKDVNYSGPLLNPNIAIGVLQNYSFNTMNPDFLLGQYVSAEDKNKLTGIATIMDLLAIDAWGLRPISHPSVPVVISKNLLTGLNSGTGDDEINYPPLGTNVTIWSWDGVLSIGYTDTEDKPWNYKFDQDFALVT